MGFGILDKWNRMVNSKYLLLWKHKHYSIFYYYNINGNTAFISCICHPFCNYTITTIKSKYFFNSLFLASCLILLELSRFLLLGGFPWLLPGLVFLDTFGQAVIPIFGVYGASYIIYFLASLIALSIFQNKNNFLFLGILFLSILSHIKLIKMNL